MILYINNEHCSSFEQLKEYFTEELTPESDTYADLLDYGRYGDIAEWLCEMREPELAVKVENIPGELSDSAFFAQLKAVILGTAIKADDSLKPSFDKCFAFESVKCDVKDNEANVIVSFKVLMSVNENYEIVINTGWGTRGEMLNLFNVEEGNTITRSFKFRKRAGKDLGELIVLVDGTPIQKIASIRTNKTSEKGKLDKDTDNERNNTHCDNCSRIPIIPLELVDDEVVKYWIKSFSKQNYWLSRMKSSKCVDLNALHNFILTNYDLNCGISTFKGNITELIKFTISELNKQLPLEVKKQMVKNSDIEYADSNLYSIIKNMLDSCVKYTGYYVGKKRPLDYVNIQDFVIKLNSNFSSSITSASLMEHAQSLSTLTSFIKNEINR